MKLDIIIPEDYCEQAKKLFKKQITLLEADYTVEELDEAAIALLGSSINRYFKSEAIIAGEEKKPKKTGAYDRARRDCAESSRIMVRMLVELGLTPNSRKKAGRTPENTPKSDYNTLLDELNGV